MVVKRIGPLSVAKNVAVLYAVLGLILGGIFSLAGIAGAFGAAAQDSGPVAGFTALFGVGAIVIFPILYACIGFIGSLIAAVFYNVVASIVGGVELEVE